MDQVTIQGIKANDHRILSRVITRIENDDYVQDQRFIELYDQAQKAIRLGVTCLLYTSPSPRDLSTSRMPSSA